MVDFRSVSWLQNINPAILVAPVVIWEMILKGIGLWKAAKNGQRNWFIAILIFNTLGILPLVYMKFFQRRLKSKR